MGRQTGVVVLPEVKAHTARGAGAWGWQRGLRYAGGAGCVLLLVCVAAYVWLTRGWPLVNDAALMHYVVFLMGHGEAPYRQIGDYNLPGSYAPEWLSMTLANGLHVSYSAMWRVLDVGLGVASAAAMVVIVRPAWWFAGMWAGSLFVLYHGRDGVGQAGQRDLWMTLLLLWAVALLLRALEPEADRARSLRALAGFGLCVGAAMTIKPQAALWLLCAAPVLRRRQRGQAAAACMAGVAVPLAAAGWFLAAHCALGAWWHAMQTVLPYHVALARETPWQLLLASSLSSVVKLLVLGGLAWLAARGEQRGAGYALPITAFCALLGLLSFMMQGKAYPYQRYPYVAFALTALALVFTQAVRSRGAWARWLGAAGFAFGVLFCAPTYLRGAVQARWPVEAEQQMAAAMITAAGSGGVAGLSGRVQCLDMVSGCVDVLLKLRLQQTTGVLYDELLFTETPAGWNPESPSAGGPPPEAVAQTRVGFKRRLEAAPPQVILLSAWLFPQGPGKYQELLSWPWLQAFLAGRYRLVSQQRFAHSENGPLGFRVYTLRGHPAQQGLE